MSRAFVKDDDTGASLETLPDRPISPHRNLVTRSGLAAIEAEAKMLSAAYAEAQTAGDRAALARVARDLRYWSERRQTAELVEPRHGAEEIQFGSTVTLLYPGGRQKSWRIVGEDEADPSKGTISYVAPLARSLMGKSVGDSVRAGAEEAEIIRIA